MKKLLSLIGNTGLLALSLALLAGPLLLGQLVGTFQSGALGEATTNTSTPPFTVQFNASQFQPYVEIDPQPLLATNTYQTSVTFTSFTKQQAAYSGLATITNTTNQPLVLSLQSGTASGVLDQSQIWLSLTTTTQSDATLTTQAAAAGATTLLVASTGGFTAGTIVIDGQTLTATAKDSTTLILATPLTAQVTAGQKTYFNPVYYHQAATPTLTTTAPITLAPHQQANLNLTVATASGDLDTNQLVLPLTIISQ